MVSVSSQTRTYPVQGSAVAAASDKPAAASAPAVAGPAEGTAARDSFKPASSPSASGLLSGSGPSTRPSPDGASGRLVRSRAPEAGRGAEPIESYNTLGAQAEAAKDRDSAIRLIRKDPRTYGDLPVSLRTDPEVVLEAVRRTPNPDGPLGGLSESQMKDRSYMLRLIGENAWVINLAPKELTDDPSFVAEAARAFPPIFTLPGFNERQKEIMSQFPGLRERCVSVYETCKKLGIDDPMRLRSGALLEEVLRNRLEPRAEDDKRPTAVVVYAKTDADHNGSLNTHNIDELTRGYRVMFYEAAKDQDVIGAIQDGAGRAGAASLVAIDGHGRRQAVYLGEAQTATLEDPSSVGDEENRLDIGDEQKFRDAGLEKCVLPDAKILLESCETGKDQAGASNTANMLARVFPGREVYAPTVSVEVSGIRLDEQGRFAGPSWLDADRNTYQTREPSR